MLSSRQSIDNYAKSNLNELFPWAPNPSDPLGIVAHNGSISFTFEPRMSLSFTRSHLPEQTHWNAVT